MKTAKKFAALLCTLSLALSLAACGQSSPDTAVNDFCKAAQTLDFTAMAEQLKGSTAERFQAETAGADERLAPLMDVLRAHAANMTYSITDSTVQDTTATVSVKFVIDDLSPIIKEAFARFIPNAITMSLTDEKPDEDEYLAQLMADFVQADAELEAGTTTATVEFTCVKTKDGGWKIADIDDDDLPDFIPDELDSLEYNLIRDHIRDMH